MATRSRTVEYVFDQRETNLALTTRLDFASKTLTIAETASRVFKSVVLSVHASHNSTTSTTMSAVLLGIKLGAVAFNDVTVTESYSGTGTSWSYEDERDVTSYFVTNWTSGTTQTCQVGVLFTGSATMNITAKLLITYEFDDASATTRTKTVKIPLESNTAALTATLVEVGTNQVPNLDTFLPEAGKVYKQICFEIEGNDGNVGTTDANLAAALDAEAEHAFGLQEQALNGARMVRHHWIRDDMVTSAAHAFKLRVSNVVLDYSSLSVVLCVTYTYDHSTTTTVVNSLEMVVGPGTKMAWWAATEKARHTLAFTIQEPATITLVQSAVRMTIIGRSGQHNHNIIVGGQSNRAYSVGKFSADTDGAYVVHRIDSGGAMGAGITLARGTNTLNVDWWNAGQYDGPDFVGCTLILNYTSGLHASGDGIHAHTIAQYVNGHIVSVAGGVNTTAALAPNIPEASYCLQNVGYSYAKWVTGSHYGGMLQVEQTASDPAGVLSWTQLFLLPGLTQYSQGYVRMVTEATQLFNRWPSDPKNLLNIKQTRRYISFSAGGGKFTTHMLLTYSAIAYAVSGTLTGYTGDGSGITVTAHSVATGEKLGSATTAAGGTYSITVYDDTANGYYVEARQDSTHVGRSENGTPSAA